MTSAMLKTLADAYLEPVLAGDRQACRGLIDNALAAGASPRQLLNELVWPMMETVQTLFKEDRVNTASLNLATRLNRWIADHLCSRLERQPSCGRKVLILCGNAEPEELGGQICAELFEAEGWQVKFAGGNVPEDEVLKLIGQERPDLLLFFATLTANVPAARKLIDYLREVDCCPQMQIMCCGGIYKRAEGLAEEIGADLYAPDGAQAVAVAQANPQRTVMTRRPSEVRMRRSRRPRRQPAAVDAPADQTPSAAEAA